MACIHHERTSYVVTVFKCSVRPLEVRAVARDKEPDNVLRNQDRRLLSCGRQLINHAHPLPEETGPRAFADACEIACERQVLAGERSPGEICGWEFRAADVLNRSEAQRGVGV
jgi:hypothetical protein